VLEDDGGLVQALQVTRGDAAAGVEGGTTLAAAMLMPPLALI
jgi:hypothetical protein